MPGGASRDAGARDSDSGSSSSSSSSDSSSSSSSDEDGPAPALRRVSRPQPSAVPSFADETDIVKRLPFIPMKKGWKVQLHPNFAGSFLRMKVQLPDGRRKSVYLDIKNNLGSYPYGWFNMPGKKPNPYWEVMPAVDEERPNDMIGRCHMEDMDKLIRLIES